jgi:hypothetical protein
MKRTLAALTAIFLAGNAPTLLGANLLANAGFESGELSPWFQDRAISGGEDWNVTTADAHSGLYSATNTGNKEIHENFTPVPVQNITNISFWAKHVGIGDMLAAELFLSNGTQRSTIVTTTANNVWQSFDVTSLTIPAGAPGTMVTGFSIFGNSDGNPSFTRTYFDDATINVPEPGSLLLAGLAGVGGLLILRRAQ